MSNYLELTGEQLKQLSYAELVEAKKELEGAEKLDVDKYNIVVNTMSEKATEQPHVENAAPAYEFINQFDFDEYAGTGSNILNSLVQGLLNKVRSQSALQSAEKDAQLREKDDIINGNEAQITNLTYQNKSLQETVSDLSTYKLNNEDYRARFEAAAAKMNEYELEIGRRDQEIERLKRRESELQQQLANAPAPTARQVIDITSEDEINALIEKAKKDKEAKRREEEAAKQAAKPKITNKRWEDEIRQQFYLAELVEDCDAGAAGTTIKFNRLNENMYRVVSEEEASRFREEQQAKSAAAVQESVSEPVTLVEEAPAIVTVEQFRPEDSEVRHDEGMDTPAVGEVAPPTLEEAFRRIEALEMAVYQRPVINGVA